MENYNFIETYENALTKEECDSIIDIFEENTNFQYERNPYHKKIEIKDVSLSLDQIFKHGRMFRSSDQAKKVKPILYKIDSIIREFYDDYIEKNEYSGIADRIPKNKVTIDSIKIQKTEPGEGYPTWHCENIPRSLTSHRVLAYTLYLNDIEEGGETEFLYQKTKVSPQTGLLCLFPAYFTHIHRGNTPINKTKYIITGWLY